MKRKLTIDQAYSLCTGFACGNKKLVLESVKDRDPEMIEAATLFIDTYILLMDGKNFPKGGGGGYVDVKAWKAAHARVTQQ